MNISGSGEKRKEFLDLQSERAEDKRRPCRRYKEIQGRGNRWGKATCRKKVATEIFQVLGMAEKL